MKFQELDHDKAHAVVNGNRFLEWDGYTIVTWRKDPRGYSDRRGEFRNGSWGLAFRYPVSDKGTWSVPASYVEHARG